MKYTQPSYEIVEIDTQDVITSSIEDNGKGSITNGEITITGDEGTFSGLFGSLL